MNGIIAAVLTYNRQALLRHCLDAIRAQTVQPQSTFVFDNGSTDGTLDMLQRDYPWVEVAQAGTNSGAAGGFSLATRIAVASGASFVWLMDDDVIPEPDALDELVAGYRALEKERPPFVLSLAQAPNGLLTNVPDIDPSRNALSYRDWPRHLERAMAPVRRATFVSILLPHETFRAHGYPLGSMFIWGEDTEFTRRITKDRPGYLVGRSRVTHVRAQVGNLSIEHEPDGPRLLWFRHLVRNSIYTLRVHERKRSVLRYALQRSRQAASLLIGGQPRKAWIIARGIAEGFLFRPDEARFANRLESAGLSFMSDSLKTKIATDAVRQLMPDIEQRRKRGALLFGR